jgi:hypothetical protein
MAESATWRPDQRKLTTAASLAGIPAVDLPSKILKHTYSSDPGTVVRNCKYQLYLHSDVL